MVGRKYLLALISALVLSLGFLFLIHDYEGSGEKVSPDSFLIEADLDTDGKKELYSLEKGCLTVIEEGYRLWSTEPGWKVDSFALGDIDNDGNINMVFSLWKTGGYGFVRPFWHKDEDSTYKNHIFVYKFEGKTFIPVWCSSNLDRPIISFEITDVDGDGLNELVVEEGIYCLTEKDRYAVDTGEPSRRGIWKWDEWGFSLQCFL